MIDRIVDFHVPHSVDDINHGRGLDLSRMQTWFQAEWYLLWSKSYSFLGPYPFVKYAQQMDKRALAGWNSDFPEDGANVCMVWWIAGSAAHFTRSHRGTAEGQ